MGTKDGLAKAPYIRGTRRIGAEQGRRPFNDVPVRSGFLPIFMVNFAIGIERHGLAGLIDGVGK